MTFDDRLHTMTYEEAGENERRYHTPVDDWDGANDPAPREPAFSVGNSTQTSILNANPFRRGEFWTSSASQSLLPGGQMIIGADWQVSGVAVIQIPGAAEASGTAHFLKPEVLPCRMKVKQFVDGRAHSGELQDEARKLYNGGGRDRHYANQAVKFRYLIKTVREDAHAFDREGRKRLAVDFMKPWWRH